MTRTIEKVSDIEYTLTLSYADEQVDLSVTRNVIGDRQSVEAYATTLDRDTRRDHALLFPMPVMPAHEEGEIV